MIECQRVENLIDDYLHEELTAEEKVVFLSHLEECSKCKGQVTAEKQVLSALRDLPHYAPSDQLIRNTLRKIDSSQTAQKSAWFDFLWESPRPIFNLALGLALVILMVINLNVYRTQQSVDKSESPTLAYQFPTPSLHSVKFVFNIAAEVSDNVRTVAVVGDFNGWNPALDKMKYDKRLNAWTLDLKLRQGNYDYMYVINDKIWVADPQAEKVRDDGFGGKNSVLEL